MEHLDHLLQPPDLFTIIGRDVAQPDQRELDEALAKSRKYWFFLASVAHAQRDHRLVPFYVDPRHALRRVPKFQARPQKLHSCPFGSSPDLSLRIEASSTWQVSATSDCNGLKKAVTKVALLQLGSGGSVPFELNEEVFSTWAGTLDENCISSNYIGILTLGWCYILSARLVELRGKGAVLRYTQSKAEYDNGTSSRCPNTPFLDIGEVDGDVARWWSAILAPGEGWEAIVTREPHDFLAPWSISRKCASSFFIKDQTFSSDSNFAPLSSERAFKALAAFAIFHDVGSQFSIALATALMIPLHKCLNLTAHLPLTISNGCEGKVKSSTQCIPQTWVGFMNDIPYYMSLSCNPEVMISSLCGSFWDPGVPCNLVSPWLHPAVNEVLGSSTTVTVRDQEILGLLCAIRRPSISALCIGAVISGLGPTILERVKGGLPPLDQNAYAWTGCAQCFMDDSGSGPYKLQNIESISRGLSHPGHHVGYLPSKIVFFELFHTKHAIGMSINMIIGTGTLKTGVLDTIKIASDRTFEMKELDPDQTASDEASFGIFHWLFINGEGLPPEKIYQDVWIKDTWDQEEGVLDGHRADAQTPTGLDSEGQCRVQSWLNQITA
ncbi:hypothetical protein N7466_008171 [Penicillium verhagenii]|uniref:uncharacterized protein n=1 Tax=Penicillium verhagenii TaxID=1562060 RepID=UPI002544FA68|nr:uncharacterized protein N7466_008171 [Penicillium verhagenii]KAJ5923984.1 hypothetical protein N7466_008171 [Penicillium verhagenii]